MSISYCHYYLPCRCPCPTPDLMKQHLQGGTQVQTLLKSSSDDLHGNDWLGYPRCFLLPEQAGLLCSFAPLHLYILAHGTSPSTQFILPGLAKFLISRIAQHLAPSEFPINDEKKCMSACFMGTVGEDLYCFLPPNHY